jgi:MFS superfamily sulfate permease-like transporter
VSAWIVAAAMSGLVTGIVVGLCMGLVLFVWSVCGALDVMDRASARMVKIWDELYEDWRTLREPSHAE